MMDTADYAFSRGLDYASIVATSEKVAWTVEEVFGDRRFDATKRIVPDSWVRAEGIDYLNEAERLALNHIRAFSYVHLFGNYEEFIPLHLTGIVEQGWHDERTHLRALLRFGEEEMKHQQLFLRAEAVLEESCGHPFVRYFDAGKQRVKALTDAILAHPPLGRFLILLALEWGSQRHYVESVHDRSGGSSDPLYVDILKYHWIEENQHTKTDLLEIERLVRTLGAEELRAAFDDFQSIARLIDESFGGQVGAELETLQRVSRRTLSDTQAATLRDVLHKSMVAVFVNVGVTHPGFQQLALELSPEGAAKLGIPSSH